MTAKWCVQHRDKIRLTVQVQPNAKQNAVIGIFGDALKVRLQAPPIEGKANSALTRWIADVLKLPKSAVTLIHGDTSRRKVLEIEAASMPAEQIAHILLQQKERAE